MKKLLALAVFSTSVLAVHNGSLVNPSRFPASGTVKTDLIGCAVVAVGPKAFLTSASCAPSMNSYTAYEVRFTLTPNTYYRAHCNAHPLYDAKATPRAFDIAACETYNEITGIAFAEVITGSPSRNAALAFVGHGAPDCRAPETRDGKLRMKRASIAGLKGSVLSYQGAQASYGDTGAGFYDRSDRLVALQISAAQGLMPQAALWLGHPEVQSFLETWADDHGGVCGISSGDVCDPR
ncbi:hypothetical protein K2X33_03645 [bacterium]|nr:hypothetical protein [bacterium]